MKIKYSPIMFNSYAKIDVNPNTLLEIVDENTIKVDDEIYEFDISSVEFPEIREQTKGVIQRAYRENNELFLTIRRFYTGDCSSWDTGEYVSFEVGI